MHFEINRTNIQQSWHSPLKDGRPYFCQGKSSSHTRKKFYSAEL